MVYSIATIVCLLILALYQTIEFAYFHRVFAKDAACTDIPPESVVLVLGFEYPGEQDGSIIPGLANVALAHQLAGCADRFSLVLTQKAILDALQQEGLLLDGKLMGKTPVQPMHPHQPGRPLRTLQALRLALQKVDPLPSTLILMAHDKQIERAALDLRSLYSGMVILWGHNHTPYARPGFMQPLRWAFREIWIARPLEGIQRMFLLNPTQKEK